MKIANRKFTSLKLIFIISLGIALMGACSKKKTENAGIPNGRVIINNDDESTDTKAVKLELIATDEAGVTGYYISEEQTDPDPDMEGWESVASAPEYSAVIDFELSDGLGTKTLYAWFKNDEAKISPVSEDSIQVTESAPYDITIKINEEATTTASRQVTLALSANDSMGITGYYILESPVKPRTPALDIAGWVDIESITNYDIDDLTFDLTSSGVGEKTVYVWFKNTLNVISSAASATIELTAKATGTITINHGLDSTISETVPVIISATDEVGITGYYISEEATPPTVDSEWNDVPSVVNFQFTIPAFTLSDGVGDKTLYVWFKNESDVISEVVSATIAKKLPGATSGSISINAGETTTTSRDLRITLAASDPNKVTGYYLSESSTVPDENTPWLTTNQATRFLKTISYTLTSSTYGDKTIYAWFKNSRGVISDEVHASIRLKQHPAPQNGKIVVNNGIDITTAETIPITLSASDEVGVTGYYISETGTAPAVDSSDWVAVTSTTSFLTSVSAFTLSAGTGDKTIYAWFKNGAGLISAVTSATIEKKLPGAATAAISINSGDRSTTSREVNLTLVASDPNKVTGYYLSESSTAPDENASWQTTEQATNFLKIVSYSLTSPGYNTKTIYAWFKNGRGVISDEVHASIKLKQHPAPQNGRIIINSGIDTTSSETVSVTLSASDEVGVTGYYISETQRPPRATASGWVNVSGTTSFLTSISAFTLSSGTGRKTIYAWFKNGAGLVSAAASAVINKEVPGAPSGSISINSGQATTISREISLTLAASDPNKVMKYYFSESSTTPGTGAAWETASGETSFFKVISYTLTSSGYGDKTIYAWFKNSKGIVSNVNDKIKLEKSTPANGLILINGGMTRTDRRDVQLQLIATSFGVTGYYVKEVNSSTTSESIVVPPTDDNSAWVENDNYPITIDYELSEGNGEKYIYVFFKNAMGVRSDGARDTILFQTRYTLNLMVTSGNVRSDYPGIDCGSDCSENYEKNSTVQLTATPESGYEFGDWSGSCLGSTNPLTITMDSDKTCWANFVTTYTDISSALNGGGIYNTPYYPNNEAFAVLKEDGSISAWGDSDYGGSGAPEGTGYIKIYSTNSAFAALKADGSVISWGNRRFGGIGAPTDKGYIKIYASESAFAALKADGSITAWGDNNSGVSGAPEGTGYVKIYSNSQAFAALKVDGSITTWGNNNSGGNETPRGTGYTKIYSNFRAFAALKADGSITAWGSSVGGGDDAPTGTGYIKIYSNFQAFAALKADGSITAWGTSGFGGSGAPTGTGYTNIYSNYMAFVALKVDGSITAWGDNNAGGSGAPQGTGYIRVYSTAFSFAALKADGSITAWGSSDYGGSGAPTGTGYTKIYSNNNAFAALKADGSITAWGNSNFGGSGAPTGTGYTKIYSTKKAFAALKADGSITVWGKADYGGSGAPSGSSYRFR